MNLVVTDTNVFIDVHDCQLLEELFALSFEIHTTEFVLFELNTPQLAALNPFIEKGQLKVKKFDEFEMRAILELVVARKGVQKRIADRSVLYLADHLRAILLGGDGDLRKEAEARKIEVHGSIWLFEQMHLQEVQTKSETVLNLKRLTKVNPRIPADLAHQAIQRLR
jgi:rRNA-processing protein FCF1